MDGPAKGFVQQLADILLRKNGVEDTETAFVRVETAGYLLKADADDDPGYVWWGRRPSVPKLAMASFGKPIRRSTADRLVAGLLERARVYNADPGRDAALRGTAPDFRKLP